MDKYDSFQDLTKAYLAVEAFYGQDRAARSGVLKIRHIQEGLVVLECLNATVYAKAAWCLHPLVQGDPNLALTAAPLAGFHPKTAYLALAYGQAANAWLSDKVGQPGPEPSDLPDVNHMLIADKVQNRKDFIIHHKATHPRSDELDLYFRKWLKALGVSEKAYHKYCWIISHTQPMFG